MIITALSFSQAIAQLFDLFSVLDFLAMMESSLYGRLIRLVDSITAIRYLEHLSNGEWQSLRDVISSCTETRYCVDSCQQKCSISALLQVFQSNKPREEVLSSLYGILNDKKDELSSKPIYCLEQGYCALYCISSCQYGKFIRALVHKRALEHNFL